jgi:hypothetical protein
MPKRGCKHPNSKRVRRGAKLARFGELLLSLAYNFLDQFSYHWLNPPFNSCVFYCSNRVVPQAYSDRDVIATTPGC